MVNNSQVINAIPSATTSKQTHWVLTATDVAVDTQTITIGGIVFTTVNTIGTTAGNVLIGANQAATLANLVTLINAPLTTTSTGVALSSADANKLKDVLGLSATSSSGVLTLTSSKKLDSLTVSETQTNMAWTSYYLSDPIAMSNPCAKTSVQFTGSSITSGNGVFTIEVSNDGSTWATYNRITSNATNTNSQTDVRVASVTVNSNAATVATIPDIYAFMRIKLVPTTDGTYNAHVYTA